MDYCVCYEIHIHFYQELRRFFFALNISLIFIETK